MTKIFMVWGEGMSTMADYLWSVLIVFLVALVVIYLSKQDVVSANLAVATIAAASIVAGCVVVFLRYRRRRR